MKHNLSLLAAAGLLVGIWVGRSLPVRAAAASEPTLALEAPEAAPAIADAPRREPAVPAAMDAAPVAEQVVAKLPVAIPASAAGSPLASGESLLSRVLWPFARRAGTVDLVLANDYLNPARKTLDAESRRELDRVLKDVLGAVSEVESEYRIMRADHVMAVVRAGGLEARLPGDDGIRQGRPRQPEEEVADVSTTRFGDGYVRVQWGDDPHVDQKRLELLDLKSRSIEQIKAFVDQNGK